MERFNYFSKVIELLRTKPRVESKNIFVIYIVRLMEGEMENSRPIQDIF